MGDAVVGDFVVGENVGTGGSVGAAVVGLAVGLLVVGAGGVVGPGAGVGAVLRYTHQLGARGLVFTPVGYSVVQ